MYNDNKIIQKIMKLCNEKQKKSEKKDHSQLLFTHHYVTENGVNSNHSQSVQR